MTKADLDDDMIKNCMTFDCVLNFIDFRYVNEM